jgi:alanyl-tRNA synthetase
MMTGSQVRRRFLDFFISKGHKEVHSSSLVPANDPTLLFTNAGMNQFKDVFLGLEKRDYSRATTSQKCVRAGGKHNDLENVGFTNRHHTFFEMLGNFSFGDYFKKDAIAYAWELVTSPEWYGMDKSKLYATIFKGENGVPRDDEAYQHWLDVGVPKERVFDMGMKDNFWAMGDTGPCGPCSEIHYDMGVASSDKLKPECAAGECKFPCECGRYVEIWNLVFMQFDRDSSGKLNLLPKPSIDTGAGLERVAAVLQGVVSNYDTDLFTPLIEHAKRVISKWPDVEIAASDPHFQGSLRVISDHARAATFLINDGVVPSNEGRGYVLRKIMRRGIRHGRQWGEKHILSLMVPAVRAVMQDAYPELAESVDRVTKTIVAEERQFDRVLTAGLERLKRDLDFARLDVFSDSFDFAQGLSEVSSIVDQAFEREGEKGVAKAIREAFAPPVAEPLMARWEQLLRMPPVLTGKRAFRLYETYGLPLDFMMDVARDEGVEFDLAGFEAARAEEQTRARASWKGGSKASANPIYQSLPVTEFGGYDREQWLWDKGSAINWYADSSGPIPTDRYRDSEIIALTRGGQSVPELAAGEEGEVILDYTPFYADSGGQVGDVGWLLDSKGAQKLADVLGCTMPVQGVRVHKVRAIESLRVGMFVDARVNVETRFATMRNHTGTHLLHAALREVLGKHVKQAGSLVDPSKLRFDFSHFTGIADEEMQDIEDIVNKEVLKNDRVEVIENVPIDVAVNEYKAMALFGEKYGDRVRVIKIGDFSTELCGGTHTAATGEIGLIKVLHEGSVSSGVRRIEAVTGENSVRHFRKDHELEGVVSTLIRSGEDLSPAAALKFELDRREEEIKKLRKELEQSRMKSAASSVSSASDNAREVKGVKVLATRADNVDRNQMRTLVDNLRTKLGSGVVVLGSVQDGKVALIVGVTKDLTGRVQAGKIIAQVAKHVGGSGGGRPDMAEAGGKDPAGLDAALNASYDVVEGLLA